MSFRASSDDAQYLVFNNNKLSGRKIPRENTKLHKTKRKNNKEHRKRMIGESGNGNTGHTL